MSAQKKIRLDQMMVQKKLVESRENAQRLILAGQVLVDDIPAKKAGQMVKEEHRILILEASKYASRGGIKLDAALDVFPIIVANKVALDIGASTGGFTDCLLQRGARKVYAVDVGYGQLSWRLRHDERVVVRERTNARYLKPDMFEEPIDLAVMDVSFIGAHKILEPLRDITHEAIVLVKPQFEAGPQDVPRGGIIRDSETHWKVLANFYKQTTGWVFRGLIESPLLGGSGNREFLVHLKREPEAGWTEDQFLKRAKELLN